MKKSYAQGLRHCNTLLILDEEELCSGAQALQHTVDLEIKSYAEGLRHCNILLVVPVILLCTCQLLVPSITS